MTKCDGMDLLFSGRKLEGEVIMDIDIIGIDLAKRLFQLHGADRKGKPVLRKRFTRSGLAAFLSNTPSTVIAMEACASAHHWGRSCSRLGHEVPRKRQPL